MGIHKKGKKERMVKMFYDNQPNSYDIGNMQQNAWDEGFEDGINRVIYMVQSFKEKHSYKVGSKALMEELEKYIDENRPRRKRQ